MAGLVPAIFVSVFNDGNSWSGSLKILMSFRDESFQSILEFLRLPTLALLYCNDLPTHLPKGSGFSDVSRDILSEFVCPKRDAGFRHRRLGTRRMTMPKTTMHENSGFCLGHDDVWRTWKRLLMKPVRHAEITQQSSHLKLGS